jgi:hypothetical protein
MNGKGLRAAGGDRGLADKGHEPGLGSPNGLLRELRQGAALEPTFFDIANKNVAFAAAHPADHDLGSKDAGCTSEVAGGGGPWTTFSQQSL